MVTTSKKPVTSVSTSDTGRPHGPHGPGQRRTCRGDLPGHRTIPVQAVPSL